MRIRILAALWAAALLQAGSPQLLGVQAPATPLALDTVVSTPIDVSPDGELLLLFLPGLRGFELVNTVTGQRDIVSSTPCTGYFATISPDKGFVCFKDFQPAGGRLLQVPCLYDIARKQVVALCPAAPVAGNPVMSSRGQIAYTLGEELIVLNADLTPCSQFEVGSGVNTLAFSPDGRRLAFADANEQVAWVDLDTGKRAFPPAGALHGYQPRFSPKGESLLARGSNGEVMGWHLASGLSRSFGRAESAAWVDEDTVALVCKETANFAVTRTQVVKSRLSDGSTSTFLTRAGDAAFALNSSMVAFGASDGIGLADARSGLVQKPILKSRAAPATITAAPNRTAPPIQPQVVVTNASTVQLLGVPYINQLYDTADSFPGGGSCCNATATLMAIQYYGRLPVYPITCTRGGTHTSYYGFYISSIYTYNGHTYNIPSSSAWGTDLAGYYGGFGYFLQDYPGDSLGRSVRLSQWVSYHNLTAGTDDSTSFSKAQTEINANHPFVVLNSLTSAGHYITCIGYVKGKYTLIFNDPYGNKAIAYPGWAGAGAFYDWPGYNNGYPNLNNVWRYIYARGTGASPGNYWDRNGATAGAGAAPSGTWDASSANWSCDPNGAIATGPWVGQNAIFSAGADSTGPYTITVSGTQPVNHLFVQRGTVTFTGGQLNFLSLGTYYTNYVSAGATAVFNLPFGGTASPDKWGPGAAVYNGASTCSGYFTLNEGTLAFGNNAALSTVRLDVGDTTGANVVTLKSADTTAHILPNYLVFLATRINIGAGGDLTFSGPVKLAANTAPAVTLAVSNGTTTFSGVLTNTGGLTKSGPGTLVLSGSSPNTYGSANANGYTTVSGGTLKLSKTAGVAAVPNGTLIVNTGGVLLLGAANQIGNAVPFTLSGGTFQTAGWSEQLGTLKLTASSAIDLGPGSTVLAFAASSGVAWTAGTLLSITNWHGSITGGSAQRVLFGSSSSGLTTAQVNQIRFANPAGFPPGNYTATILGSGEAVPLTAPPSIIAQPQNRVAVAGDTVAFSCSAVGTPVPACQWQYCGTNIPGATSWILSLTNVTLSRAGTYAVAVTNVAGSTLSSNAMLSVYSSAAPALSATGMAGNGQFQFNLAGVPGYNYAIWASTNLGDWVLLQTTASPFTFTDTNASGFQNRFYRAQYIP